MSLIESIVLGIIQGLTEFLPVSSSGHLEIGKALLNVELEENLSFTVMVHFATVLSTITVFFREIKIILIDVFKFRWNPSTIYLSKILLSMIPVLIVGVFFQDEVEALFTGNVVWVGIALLGTALLLFLTTFLKTDGHKKIPFGDAFIMGIAQALAVIPGLSRSGSTIATGLLLKNKKDEVAQFSFLMVLIPIIGAALMKIMQWTDAPYENLEIFPLIAGLIAAYISGYLACRWMINIVKKGKLYWFAIYCAIIGIVSIIFS
ncbi:undecaprenyl-diphosphate phosphatase [Bacteroidota bacterium]